ncbi:MAG: GNAT family N-acetyltransferase [Chitinophagaceae bacterium]|nr:GNAT family N-acetyltransferase [Chitinophagaceae bacterium]MCW5929552.1 GNAT family N-acetyltransferase [Chitinophagaceae bacterium]
MKVRLRLWSRNDNMALAELANNINIWNNLRDRLPYPYQLQHANEFISHCLLQPSPTIMAIEADGILAGCIGVEMQTDISRISAELGYWVGEPFWGKQVATIAVRQMTEYTFSYFPQIIRLFARVFEFNKASMRVLEKNGFHLESIQKRAVIKNDRILDDYVWVRFRE